ncbi:MAG: urate hydroxylase PuuD [Rhodospirillaceae bacterium]|nr:urate hydroxylase PuuD [Rhodospirillaceae bacterium]
MEGYIAEWLSLLVRWSHFIVGIAWIGASFYFIWLDNHLEEPKLAADVEKGVGGELWAVHGGGFYQAQKYKVAPPTLPATLHWFKWEAYTTFITGFFLLCIVYYYGAESHLIDPAVADLSPGASIAIGIGAIAAGWIVYDLLCRSPLGKNDNALAAVMAVLLAAVAFGLCQVFSGRGAFIHFGAIIGTIMVANVFFVIIPGQRELVKAKQEGRLPDPIHGQRGKQRSVHNTYFTLPVLFTMISSHYGMTYGHRYNWLILVAISLAGALIRVWFVLRHKGRASPIPLVLGLVLLAGTAVAIAPAPAPSSSAAEAVPMADLRAVIGRRCTACHSAKPTQEGFQTAPKGLKFDNDRTLRANAEFIYKQVVVEKIMPPGNLTEMTDEERGLVKRWFESGSYRR